MPTAPKGPNPKAQGKRSAALGTESNTTPFKAQRAVTLDAAHRESWKHVPFRHNRKPSHACVSVRWTLRHFGLVRFPKALPWAIGLGPLGALCRRLHAFGVQTTANRLERPPRVITPPSFMRSPAAPKGPNPKAQGKRCAALGTINRRAIIKCPDGADRNARDLSCASKQREIPRFPV